jgi:hypothetical protein
MLRDCRFAHGEGLGDFAGGAFAVAEQALDNGETGGVGQGAKNGGKR